ncbi:MAG: isochorismatase family protein [Gammaproteobacteria bacterium]
MENNSATATLCQTDDSSLLVVDVQERLTTTIPAKVLTRLKRNINLLVYAAEKLAIPVYASEQYPAGLGPLEADIKKNLPADSKLYEKTCFSCYGVAEFKQQLADSKRRQVIVTGMEAHVCILQTALDLHRAGYSVFITADAICSRQRESYETALYRMRRANVVICDTESVLFEWLGDSRHEHFKSIQGLLK